MEVVESFDAEYCWDVLKFYDNNDEVGVMNIVIDDGEAFIHSVSSYKKGYGTKMINYLKDCLDVVKIEGDADPDSIGFWNKFNPIWSDDSFVIEFNN